MIIDWFMVLNATFNNISVRSWRSVLLVEEIGVPGENHWPAASHWQTLSHNVVLSTPRLSRFKLTTLVVETNKKYGMLWYGENEVKGSFYIF
jgi:hypothetical protein